MNEEDESFTCEEQSQQEDFMVKDMCLIGDEEIRKVDVKSNRNCTIGEEESLKNDENRV